MIALKYSLSFSINNFKFSSYLHAYSYAFLVNSSLFNLANLSLQIFFTFARSNKAPSNVILSNESLKSKIFSFIFCNRHSSKLELAIVTKYSKIPSTG